MRAWDTEPDRLTIVQTNPRYRAKGLYVASWSEIERLREIAANSLSVPNLPWEQSNVAQTRSSH